MIDFSGLQRMAEAAVKAELQAPLRQLLADLGRQATTNAPVSPAIISQVEQLLSKVT
jgi:hypothetical protein